MWATKAVYFTANMRRLGFEKFLLSSLIPKASNGAFPSWSCKSTQPFSTEQGGFSFFGHFITQLKANLHGRHCHSTVLMTFISSVTQIPNRAHPGV